MQITCISPGGRGGRGGCAQVRPAASATCDASCFVAAESGPLTANRTVRSFPPLHCPPPSPPPSDAATAVQQVQCDEAGTCTLSVPAVQLYQEDPTGNVAAVFDQNVQDLSDNSQRVTIPRTAVRSDPYSVLCYQ